MIKNMHFTWIKLWFDLTGAPDGWDITKGSKDTKVGVIDCDMDGTHSDLRGNVAASVGTRTPCAGGHGTHVAGIIGAEGNNGQGVTGMSWQSSLHLYDYLGGFTGSNNAILAQKAMVQAVKDGNRVVNMSLGWIDTNKCVDGTPETLVKVAETNGILAQGILYGLREKTEVLWVFAAGNECREAKYKSLVIRQPISIEYNDRGICTRPWSSDIVGP